MIRGLALAAFLCAIALPMQSLAQAATPDASKDEAAADDMEKKLAEMEARFQKEIDALKKETAKNKEETESLQFELETMSLQEAGNDLDTNAPLTVYGFFDLSYSHLLNAKDTSLAFYVPTVPSFLMSSINLYFLSQMTDTLSAILELKFSFLPHGQITGYEAEIYVEDALVGQEGEYTTVSTRVVDPFTSQFFYQGGVTIERVHLTYSPFDWLQVIAGRYLTPYGIWNIDHGSPVVLPVRLPYMQIREMVPLAQTGLQIFGRVYATDKLSFDYAVTLSNGRGAMEQVYDLDKNKGVGVKAKFNYVGDKVKFSIGGYGYYGQVTSTKKVTVMQMNTDMTLDEENYAQPLTVDTRTTNQYDEFVVAADFLLELYGVRLQSEYVYNYIDYEVTGPIAASEVALKGGSPLEDYYWASYIGNDVYVLLAYELPLEKWISPVRLTPYFMYEYGDPMDIMPQIGFQTFLAGLNIKPSPYVVLKAEYSYAIPKSTMAYGENIQNVSAQMAVSF